MIFDMSNLELVGPDRIQEMLLACLYKTIRSGCRSFYRQSVYRQPFYRHPFCRQAILPTGRFTDSRFTDSHFTDTLFTDNPFYRQAVLPTAILNNSHSTILPTALRPTTIIKIVCVKYIKNSTLR
jgi:hypothetical protein